MHAIRWPHVIAWIDEGFVWANFVVQCIGADSL
jgi:hypothetical protein